MTYRFKSTRRQAQRRKARTTTRTSRAFLHTLDRLAARRDCAAKLHACITSHTM